MARSRPLGITQEELHRLFELRDGVLYWRVSVGRVSTGSMAGTTNHTGYHQVCICGRLFLRSRLVWMHVHGVDSHPNQIDHINRISNDDRPENLRVVTGSENMSNQNVRGVSGKRFVAKNYGRWIVRVPAEGRDSRGRMRQRYLGRFDTEEEAAAAVREWEASNTTSFRVCP